MSIRVRFAPSPTGSLHLGTARTAVVNWLFARSQGGELVLRFDDTDRERSTEQSAKELLTDLEWLGIGWDEGPLLQSERQGTYETALDKLVAAGLTYEDDGAAYLRVPQAEPLVFDDLLRGRIEFPAGSKDDFVIRRSDGSFTYNFATAVDDSEMDISHVIRGEDHISNTPLQVLVIAGIGKTPPQYLHLPLLLADDGSKLSKRHGAVSIAEYREQGYLAEALLNYLALVSFTPDSEVLNPAALVASFATEKLHDSAARFDPAKLRWLSGQHLRRKPLAEFTATLQSFLDQPVDSEAELAALQTAGDTMAECAAAALLFEGSLEPDESAREALAGPEANLVLNSVLAALEAGQYSDVELAAALLQGVKEELAEGGVKPRTALRAIRAALTGRTSGPELPYIVAALPGEEIERRLRRYA